MIVCRDRETGPVHPSIRSAPSTGRSGMFFSVTDLHDVLLGCSRVTLAEIRGQR